MYMHVVKQTVSDESLFLFDKDNLPKQIAVIGCGDCGSTIVTRLNEKGINGVLTVALNTTGTGKQLDIIQADERIFIDVPLRKEFIEYEPLDNGEYCAKMAESRLRDLLCQIDPASFSRLCIIIASLGEGCGSGAAPVVAKIARSMDFAVMGIGINTRNLPGNTPHTIQDQSLAALRAAADSTWVVDLQVLVPEFKDLPIEGFIQKTQDIVAETVKRICDTVNEPSVISVDPLDVRTILKQSGDIVLVRGDGSGDNRVAMVIEDCSRRRLPSRDIFNAKGCIISVYTGIDITMNEVEEVLIQLLGVSPKAENVLCIRPVSGMEGKINVWAIFTGLAMPGE